MDSCDRNGRSEGDDLKMGSGKCKGINPLECGN